MRTKRNMPDIAKAEVQTGQRYAPRRGEAWRIRTAGHACAGLALAASWLLTSPAWGAFYVREDANGFVVLDAEHFDKNITRDNAAWVFDNTPTLTDAFSGWGYMKSTGAGGTNMNSSARLDFNIKFDFAGPHYVWVLGSDAGGKQVSVGLNGVVTTNSIAIGGPDGIFGVRDAGQWRWVGTNRPPGALDWNNKAFINVPSTLEHTFHLFIYDAGTWVDKIVLTTNINWRPEPFNPGTPGVTNAGATNIPAPRLISSGSTKPVVFITQPFNGQTFVANSNLVVTIAAKAITNISATPISKVEFFARALPATNWDKIAETVALPHLVRFTNPPVADYELMAVVTDTAANVATSSVVSASVRASSYLVPLVWTTNTFDTGLGPWTLAVDNHASGWITNTFEGWVFNWFFSLDWTNSANAGGTPGEFGGHIARMNTVAPFVAHPFSRRVSLNEELWFRGRVRLRNYGPDATPPPATNKISCNSDTFIGYFDSTSYGSPPRIGLKLREPTSYGNSWRLAIANKPDFADFNFGNATDNTPFTFDLHWIPSGAGDGSGTLAFTVAGITFSTGFGPSSSTFDAFGFVAVQQGSDEPWRQADQFFDNVEYLAPGTPRLEILKLDATRTLLSWEIPDFVLQYSDGALPLTHTNASWTDISTNLYVNVGGRFYYTNTIGTNTRWFQLRSP
jgi:hypothetical protein